MTAAAFSSRQEALLLWCGAGASVCSMVGSAFIIASFARFPQLRSFVFNVIACLAVADVGADAAYFLGDHSSSSDLCDVQGVMRIYFNLVSIFLTTVVANILFHVIVNEDYFSLIERQRRCPTYQLYAWGLPVVLTLLPFLTNNYGNNGAWCSITSDRGRYWWGIAWHILCFYLPCWAAVLYNSRVYITVQRVPHRDVVGTKLNLQYQFVERLQLYPLVLVVSWTPATIFRVQATIAPDHPAFWLALVGYSLSSLMGFMNACVYAMTPSVRRAWAEDPCVKVHPYFLMTSESSPCLFKSGERPSMTPPAALSVP